MAGAGMPTAAAGVGSDQGAVGDRRALQPTRAGPTGPVWRRWRWRRAVMRAGAGAGGHGPGRPEPAEPAGWCIWSAPGAAMVMAGPGWSRPDPDLEERGSQREPGVAGFRSDASGGCVLLRGGSPFP